MVTLLGKFAADHEFASQLKSVELVASMTSSRPISKFGIEPDVHKFPSTLAVTVGTAGNRERK